VYVCMCACVRPSVLACVCVRSCEFARARARVCVCARARACLWHVCQSHKARRRAEEGVCAPPSLFNRGAEGVCAFSSFSLSVVSILSRRSFVFISINYSVERVSNRSVARSHFVRR
jgi:hypothetical protein